METVEKVRENRIRRMARRQGLALVKSRRRDPYALDFGQYGLVPDGENIVEYGLSLDDVEARLTRRHRG